MHDIVKKIEEYMKLPYRMELIPDMDEGGYTVSFPDLPGCLTCGETYEDALRNAEDSKQEWFVAAMEENIEIPEPDSLDAYSGQFKIRMPKSFHRHLAQQAKREGVSMNQILCSLGPKLQRTLDPFITLRAPETVLSRRFWGFSSDRPAGIYIY